MLKPGAPGDATRGRAEGVRQGRASRRYKYPRAIEFIAELPKTATGKIQRFQLREREARERDAAEGEVGAPTEREFVRRCDGSRRAACASSTHGSRRERDATRR